MSYTTSKTRKTGQRASKREAQAFKITRTCLLRCSRSPLRGTWGMAVEVRGGDVQREPGLVPVKSREEKEHVTSRGALRRDSRSYVGTAGHTYTCAGWLRSAKELIRKPSNPGRWVTTSSPTTFRSVQFGAYFSVHISRRIRRTAWGWTPRPRSRVCSPPSVCRACTGGRRTHQ